MSDRAAQLAARLPERYAFRSVIGRGAAAYVVLATAMDEMRDRGVALDILAPEGYRSPTVTTIKTPDPWNGPRLAAEMKARGFVIATGYGKLKDTTFRIGHMGDHTVEELDELLSVLEDILIR